MSESKGRVAPSGFVVLHLDPDGRAVRVWGPFETEHEADAFGLAHTPVWTIWPLEAPNRERVHRSNICEPWVTPPGYAESPDASGDSSSLGRSDG